MAEGRVTGGSSISDERHALPVRVSTQVSAPLEGGQRPQRFRPGKNAAGVPVCTHSATSLGNSCPLQTIPASHWYTKYTGPRLPPWGEHGHGLPQARVEDDVG